MELNLTPVSINKHKQDPAWNHCQAFKNGDRVQIKCMYCGKMFKGGGIHRFKEHLAGKKGQCPSCEQVPQSVRAFMLESLNGRSKKQDNKQRTLPDLFDCGNSSPYVGEMDLSAFHDDVNNGIKPNQVLNTLGPSSDLVATEKGEISQGSRDSRKRGRSKSLLANSESCAKSSDLALVSKGVENPVQLAIGRFLLDIGMNSEAVNSVYFQPMIDAIASAGSGTVPPSCQELRGSILKSQYFLTGKMLMESFPSLYWAPSMAHCVDMMLEDFGNIEWINETIAQAKSVTRFVYNHSVILNMMRRFTFGNDIVEPAVTRSATNFATLQRMADLKLNLQTMINSQDWLECQYAKKPGGQVMVDIVRNRSFWNSCVLIVRLTYPLLKVLEIAGSKKISAMGYVYAGIYRAKETIKKELVKKDDYMVYWNIIDHRWEQQRHLPLYAAGFFFNPKFFYSSEGNLQSDILSSMFDCIERLVPDINIQDQIIKEINLYKNASGDLGRPIAVRARDNLLPGKDSYTVQLVLRNQEKDSVDPLSVDSKVVLEDWIADNVVGLEDCGSSDWTTLDPPVGNRMVSGPSGDEIEDFLGTGFADLDIFSGLKGVKQDI
ncbi:putative Zinc finger, BED-type [Corchorus olitorius]|uniref:Zinc finger, BED-type n=1 Tax=Corchorus olitorius TaxID=93759 RepID=A0A1R3GRZ0_9ROSI|nr:putative Zinc finger, BED-type [Corchorus olitorius]